MRNYKQECIEKINERFGENAPYIIKAIDHELDMFDYYLGMEKYKDQRFMEWKISDVLSRAERAHNGLLTPVTAKVGDGATINLYTDRHACTIVKVTKTTITVRRDKAILNPNFRPEFIVGGFAAHCTNQDEQSYTYEPDEDGDLRTFHWSKKYNQYGTPSNLTLSRGRHEYYDYNF